MWTNVIHYLSPQRQDLLVITHCGDRIAPIRHQKFVKYFLRGLPVHSVSFGGEVMLTSMITSQGRRPGMKGSTFDSFFSFMTLSILWPFECPKLLAKNLDSSASDGFGVVVGSTPKATCLQCYLPY